MAITPASGYVGPLAAIAIGAVAGFLCFNACNFKTRLGYDDSLDVVGVHGVGGTWGAIATGLFASKAINPAGADGLLYGNPKQLSDPAGRDGLFDRILPGDDGICSSSWWIEPSASESRRITK